MRALSCDAVACAGRGRHEEDSAFPLIEYAPAPQGGDRQGQESADSAGTLASAALGTDTAVAEVDGCQVQYVSREALEAVREKVERGLEVSRVDLDKLASPERLEDGELVVPILMGADLDAVEDMVRKHGPRGVANVFLNARKRCEDTRQDDSMAARDWRLMTWETDGTFKPLLLALISCTALGSGILLTMTRDASRAFLLMVLIQVNAEEFLWTYLLFGPDAGHKDSRWVYRLAVRIGYFLGDFLILILPGRTDLLAGPSVICLYCALSGVSRLVCFWLGIFYYFYRFDVNLRRLGTALLIHGFSFQLAALDFMNPVMFGDDGTVGLHGWGWCLHTLSSLSAFAMLTPIFKAGQLNMRAQQPAMRSICFIFVGTLCSLVALPLLAGNSLAWVTNKPSFLPRGWFLVAYKVLTSAVGMGVLAYALNEYNTARQRPLHPIAATFVGSPVWAPQSLLPPLASAN